MPLSFDELAKRLIDLEAKYEEKHQIAIGIGMFKLKIARGTHLKEIRFLAGLPRSVLEKREEAKKAEEELQEAHGEFQGAKQVVDKLERERRADVFDIHYRDEKTGIAKNALERYQLNKKRASEAEADIIPALEGFMRAGATENFGGDVGKFIEKINSEPDKHEFYRGIALILKAHFNQPNDTKIYEGVLGEKVQTKGMSRK